MGSKHLTKKTKSRKERKETTSKPDDYEDPRRNVCVYIYTNIYMYVCERGTATFLFRVS